MILVDQRLFKSYTNAYKRLLHIINITLVFGSFLDFTMSGQYIKQIVSKPGKVLSC